MSHLALSNPSTIIVEGNGLDIRSYIHIWSFLQATLFTVGDELIDNIHF